MAHPLIEEINTLSCNRDKVKRFIDLGLHPKFGLSSEMTLLMFDLYAQSSGDNQYAGRMGCSSCQDTIFRKLQDFVSYGDNVGASLLNWEPEVVVATEEPTKKTTKKK